MNIGKAIYSILSGDANISAIVSGKIYPVVIPQGVDSPCIKYTVISDRPTNSKDGVSKLDTYTVQIDCFSPKYSEADDLSQKVRDALDRFKGTASGIEIDHIIFEDTHDMYDQASNEHFKSDDYRVRVKL